MAMKDDEVGWDALLSGVVRNVAAVPAVLGFVTVGAAVLAGRSLLDVASTAWRRSGAAGQRQAPLARGTRRRAKRGSRAPRRPEARV